MPVLLKKDEWRVKDPLSGNYTGAAILSTTLPEDAAQIVENTQTALNSEELRAEQIINNTQNAVNGINSQSDMILESISKTIHNGTDTTLEIEGMPADAKATGNLQKKLMKLPTENDYGENGQYPRSTGSGIEWVDYGLPSDEQTTEAINNWLNAHPEATTTVQDGSLTLDKFTNETKNFIEHDYITPQMYGAKADGITDDTDAIQAALDDQNAKLVVMIGDFLITKTIIISNKNIYHVGSIIYNGTESAIKIQKSNNCNITLSTISAINGTGIEFYATNGESSSESNYCQYINLYFNTIQAKYKCIYLNLDVPNKSSTGAPNTDTVGWINEIRIFNGRFSGNAEYGIYGDSKEYPKMNCIKLYNVGIEGVTTGIYMANSCSRWSFENLRYAESFETLIKTENEVLDFQFLGAQTINMNTKCSFSNGTFGIFRIPVYNDIKTELTNTTLIISNGKIHYDNEQDKIKVNNLDSLVNPRNINFTPITYFTAPVNNLSFKSLVINLKPKQEQIAPNTPLQFSEWTQCNIIHTGKNLFPNLKFQRGTNYVYIGQNTGQTHFDIFLKAGQYTIHTEATKSAALYYKETNDTTGTRLGSSKSVYSIVFNIPKDGFYQFWLYNSTNGILIDDVILFQLEKDALCTNYEPGQKNTYTINFPSSINNPIYAGTLDMIKSKLNVYQHYASYNNEDLIGPWVSNMDEYTTEGTPTIGAEVIDLGKIAISYDLDNIPNITTITGINCIYADCGDVSVAYNSQIEALFEKFLTYIAPIENENTASQTYAQGAFFFHNGNFCKATTLISQGDEFINTNYEITTIAAELIAL